MLELGLEPCGDDAFHEVCSFVGIPIPQRGLTIHAKTTLIDDQFAIIGSTNCMQRSLYTDWDHSIGILDEDQVLVKTYRKALWNEVFRHNDPQHFEDIQSSLRGWNPAWGTAGGSAPSLPVRVAPEPAFPYMAEVPLPYTPATPWDSSLESYHRRFTDVDSREPWSLCF